VEKHKFEIITECDVKDMLAIELHWGLFYNVLDKKAGLNSKLPKNGEEYQCVSEETKEKLRVFNTGKVSPMKGKKSGIIPWNKGIKTGLKSPMRGKKHTKESRIKMSESSLGQVSWNKGKAVPEDVKKKISNTLKGNIPWNKGKEWSEESKKKMSESSMGQIAWNRKLVLCLQTGVFYESCKEASEMNKIRRTTLQAMLDGQNKNKTTLIYV
jgi:hypothetical protein